MSLSIVQQKTGTTVASSFTVTLDSAITAGNSLTVLISSTASGASITGVSGGGASDWAVQASANRIGIWYTEIWLGNNVGGGSTGVTVTFATAPTGAAKVWVIETAPVVVSGTNGATGGNGTSINSGNVTPTSGADVVIYNVGDFQGSGTTATAGPSGWTDLTGGGPTTNQPASYKLVPSASGSYNATYAIGYNNYTVSIAAFKASGGGGGGTSSPYYLSYYSRLVLGVID